MRNLSAIKSRFVQVMWPVVKWLRANPLGPAVTVCLAGLAALFALPQLTVWVIDAPKLVLAEVVLSAPFVPYAVYRVHHVRWQPMAALWSLIYLIGLIRTPAPLKVMHSLAISAHMTGWFMWGFVLTAIYAWWMAAHRQPPAPPDRTQSPYDNISSPHAS